ncbi:hypothetical protein B0A53_04317 [Rhodotorula sp. CCFEE 5036]|nr:hypothetical protein B0A53_04317 [Rhodotorula sp. CCFEE 5036]
MSRYTPNPRYPGDSEQERAAWADAHARAFFFDEIFGGHEGAPAVQQNFCAFLRCVDNLLQPLTLGISPASRQNEEVTTAKYHI